MFWKHGSATYKIELEVKTALLATLLNTLADRKFASRFLVSDGLSDASAGCSCVEKKVNHAALKAAA